jgi:hypothetical protein
VFYKPLTVLTLASILTVATLPPRTALAQMDTDPDEPSETLGIQCSSETRDLVTMLRHYEESAQSLGHIQDEMISRHQHTLKYVKVERVAGTVAVVAGSALIVLGGAELAASRFAIPALAPKGKILGFILRVSGAQFTLNFLRTGIPLSLLTPIMIAAKTAEANSAAQQVPAYASSVSRHAPQAEAIHATPAELREAIQADLDRFGEAHQRLGELEESEAVAKILQPSSLWSFGWEDVRRVEARLAIAQAHRELHTLQENYSRNVRSMLQRLCP